MWENAGWAHDREPRLLLLNARFLDTTGPVVLPLCIRATAPLPLPTVTRGWEGLGIPAGAPTPGTSRTRGREPYILGGGKTNFS